LSPELVVGEEHTQASDMWAMGAILYELASLLPPFDHSHPRGLAERILSGPPRLLPTRCPQDCQDICSKLMQRKPEERLSSTQTVCLPIIQEQLHKLFDDEPPFHPGTIQTPTVTTSQAALSTTPRRGGFGHLLQKTPAATPRGLRCIGEHVTGVKCGAVGVTGTTFLRKQGVPLTPSRTPPPTEGGQAADYTPEVSRAFSKRLSSKTSMASKRHSSKASCVSADDGEVAGELANEHARLYAGIMVETALEELNFSSSRLLEEDVAMERFSLPTAVDRSSGATWQVAKEVISSTGRPQSSHTWDVAPPAHRRDFPRFS